jgi:hypothetical protein
MLGWVLFGVVVVAIVIVALLYFRSLRRWHQPPPGPGDQQGQSTLTWMTFSQGDQSGGV